MPRIRATLKRSVHDSTMAADNNNINEPSPRRRKLDDTPSIQDYGSQVRDDEDGTSELGGVEEKLRTPPPRDNDDNEHDYNEIINKNVEDCIAAIQSFIDGKLYEKRFGGLASDKRLEKCIFNVLGYIAESKCFAPKDLDDHLQLVRRIHGIVNESDRYERGYSTNHLLGDFILALLATRGSLPREIHIPSSCVEDQQAVTADAPHLNDELDRANKIVTLYKHRNDFFRLYDTESNLFLIKMEQRKQVGERRRRLRKTHERTDRSRQAQLDHLHSLVHQKRRQLTYDIVYLSMHLFIHRARTNVPVIQVEVLQEMIEGACADLEGVECALRCLINYVSMEKESP